MRRTVEALDEGGGAELFRNLCGLFVASHGGVQAMEAVESWPVRGSNLDVTMKCLEAFVNELMTGKRLLQITSSYENVGFVTSLTHDMRSIVIQQFDGCSIEYPMTDCLGFMMVKRPPQERHTARVFGDADLNPPRVDWVDRDEWIAYVDFPGCRLAFVFEDFCEAVRFRTGLQVLHQIINHTAKLKGRPLGFYDRLSCGMMEDCGLRSMNCMMKTRLMSAREISLVSSNDTYSFSGKKNLRNGSNDHSGDHSSTRVRQSRAFVSNFNAPTSGRQFSSLVKYDLVGEPRESDREVFVSMSTTTGSNKHPSTVGPQEPSDDQVYGTISKPPKPPRKRVVDDDTTALRDKVDKVLEEALSPGREFKAREVSELLLSLVR